MSLQGENFVEGNSVASISSPSFAVTGRDRGIVVLLSWHLGTTADAVTVTRNGVALTRLGEIRNYGNIFTDNLVAAWVQKDADVANGSFPVVVTFPASRGGIQLTTTWFEDADMDNLAYSFARMNRIKATDQSRVILTMDSPKASDIVLQAAASRGGATHVFTGPALTGADAIIAPIAPGGVGGRVQVRATSAKKLNATGLVSFTWNPNIVGGEATAADESGAMGAIAVAVPPPEGRVRYWNGSSWLWKPMKAWSGAAWTTKKAKYFTGSAWKPTREREVANIHTFERDSRLVYLLDSRRGVNSATQGHGLQLYTGQPIEPTVQLDRLLNSQFMHADGVTPWVGLEGGEFVCRLKQGQSLFAANTARAEYFGPNVGNPFNLPFTIDEEGAYWFGWNISFGADLITNTGVQSGGGPNTMTIAGLHSITFGDLPNSAGQDAFTWFITGNEMSVRVNAPAVGGQQEVYDVRTVPFSTTVVGTFPEDPGAGLGAARIWRVVDAVANTQYKFIKRIKFNDVNVGSPRFELWVKKGAGPLTKVIDHAGPNTYSSGGVRYYKEGLYSYDNQVLNPAWWGDKDTRTMRIKDSVVMRDVAPLAGEKAIDESVLLAWLER